jgi:hypothetical protein
MMFPLVLDLAADSIPVAVTCRVLGFSKRAFYQWKANPVSQRDWDDAHLINAAMEIHRLNPVSIDPDQFLHEQLAQASPDLVRELLGTFINALPSGQADSVCGAE